MIYFFGDIHGNFGHVRERALADRPQAIVLLGDIEAQRPMETEIAPVVAAGIEVYWIRGNHDSDTQQNWQNLAASMHRNIDGRVVEVAGVRIAGLGGVFRGEVWYPDHPGSFPTEPLHASYAAYCQHCDDKRPARLRAAQAKAASLCQQDYFPGEHRAEQDAIRHGKEQKHTTSIFWDDYERLWQQRADILVTHEAPSCHPNGFATLDLLGQAMGVHSLFHGHHHDCLDYRASDARLGFKAYGVGFCGILDEAGSVIQPGDFDEQRCYRQQRIANEQEGLNGAAWKQDA